MSITFLQSDILKNVKGKYDVIISNPPYIREDEEIMDIVRNNEPHLALYAKDNGLYFYKEILKNAHKSRGVQKYPIRYPVDPIRNFG